MYAGFDPGRSGSVVFLKESGEFVAGFTLPYKESNVDVHGLAELFAFDYRVIATVEDVHIWKGNSASSSRIQLINFGRILGCLENYSIKYELVRPAVWKKFLGLKPVPKSERKIESARVARLIWPDANFKRGRKEFHDGIVEAALIAEYGRRK